MGNDSMNEEMTMRRSVVLVLPLLAGCASAHVESAQPSATASQPGIITRIGTSEGTVPAGEKVRAEPATVTVAGACQTGDRMPVARLDADEAAPMPNTRPTRALSYIPNACPVTVAPAQKPAVPAVHQRVPTAPVQP
jgi:hypothetical protein